MGVANVGGRKVDRCRDAHLSRMTGRASRSWLPRAKSQCRYNAQLSSFGFDLFLGSTLPSFFPSPFSLFIRIPSCLHARFLQFEVAARKISICRNRHFFSDKIASNIIDNSGSAGSYSPKILEEKDKIEERSEARSNRCKRTPCFLLSSDEPRIPI